jgi:hypothetical protein
VNNQVTTNNWRDIAREGKADFLFQGFRPHGDGLAGLFRGVVGESEIVPRLLDVYRSTSSGYRTGSEGDAYFIVREPISAEDHALRHLAHQHFSEMFQLVAGRKPTNLPGLEQSPDIQIVRNDVSAEDLSTGPEVVLVETVHDLMMSTVPLESDFLLLNEAFYHINCDYFLRHYLLWPLYRPAFQVGEPFEPYFKLWQRGARPVWVTPRVVRVYVPLRKEA